MSSNYSPIIPQKTYLNKTEQELLWYIQTASDVNEQNRFGKWVYIDYALIAKTFGCHKRTIHRALKSLKNADWIKSERLKDRPMQEFGRVKPL